MQMMTFSIFVDFLPSLINTTAILQLHHMETDILGSSSSEQGSSWAVEVGGHLKVHSILVENLSNNGQMLIEVRVSMTWNITI